MQEGFDQLLERNHAAEKLKSQARMGSYGVFYTKYSSNYSTAGTLTKMETMSLAILALSLPSHVQNSSPFYAFYGGVLEALIVLTIVVATLSLGVYVVRKPKK